MDRNKFKKERRNKIRRRIRSTIHGTANRPRLAIYKSNKHVYLQLIDDLEGKTLIATSSGAPSLKEELKGKAGIEQAKVLGEQLAKAALEQGIDKVVYDRSGYKYHGIVKAAADAAREGGLDL
ncbi:MAG: 50S ribosomal protein L18 [Balneolaceae bacterium]